MLNPGASIILTGSTSASNGTPAFGVYAASKAAIRSFGRTWAAELVATTSGSTPCPWAGDDTGTGGLAAPGKEQELLDDIASGIPMGRLGDPDEIASAVVFLASDQSGYMPAPNCSSTAEKSKSQLRRPHRATTLDERKGECRDQDHRRANIRKSVDDKCALQSAHPPTPTRERFPATTQPAPIEGTTPMASDDQHSTIPSPQPSDALAGKLERSGIQRSTSSIPGRDSTCRFCTEIPVCVESGSRGHPGEEVGYILAGTVSVESPRPSHADSAHR